MFQSIKKTLTAFLPSFFFLLSACAPKEALPDAPQPSTKKEESIAIPNPMAPPPPKRDENVWQVDDVDISAVREDYKHIAFTFDDAPGKTLEQLVSVFLSYNKENPDAPASATVFCNGTYLNDYTRTPLQAAYTAGFELGNHTYSHKNLTALTQEELAWEIERNDEILSEIDGKQLHLLRAPYGKIDERVKTNAKTPIINWYIDTLDWQEKNAEEIYQTVFSKKSDGAIVLMHDGYESTVDALKRLLPDLKAAGYQILSVSQMAKFHRCPLRVGGVYTRARKKTS